MTMRNPWRNTAFTLGFALGSACGPSVTGSDPPLEFTGPAVASLPQVEDPAGARRPRPLPEGTIADHDQLLRFFKRECHMYPTVDYCPPDVDVAANEGSNPYKFSSTTLLGLIFHAEMYSGGLKTSCSLTAGTVNADSFVAADPGGDPARYLLDTFALYECRGAAPQVGPSVYQAYSIDPGYQATLTTRYETSTGEGPDATDLFQVYVTLTDGAPTLLAFNNAGVSSLSSRAVLIVNLVDHRFAVKYATTDTVQYFVNAVGVGGVDPVSGVENAGHYFTRFSADEGVDTSLCVDNVGQFIEASDAACVTEGVPVAWDGTSAVAAYLGLSAEETTRLAPYLEVLADSAPLGSDAVPQGVDEGDTSFPMEIQ